MSVCGAAPRTLAPMHTLTRIYYIATALTAYIGQLTAVTTWLDIPPLAAAPLLAVLELGGLTMAVHADRRRRTGETAVLWQILSLSTVLLALAINWWGHTPWTLPALFFTGLSAIGYCVWLLDSADRRADALRRSGKQARTTPTYPLLSWLTQPRITWRASTLAQEDASLTWIQSLQMAEAEAQTRTIQDAVIAHITARYGDEKRAALAVATLDMDQIISGLMDRSDTDQWVADMARSMSLWSGPDQTTDQTMDHTEQTTDYGPDQTRPVDHGISAGQSSGPDRPEGVVQTSASEDAVPQDFLDQTMDHMGGQDQTSGEVDRTGLVTAGYGPVQSSGPRAVHEDTVVDRPDQMLTASQVGLLDEVLRRWEPSAIPPRREVMDALGVRSVSQIAPVLRVAKASLPTP